MLHLLLGTQHRESELNPRNSGSWSQILKSFNSATLIRTHLHIFPSFMRFSFEIFDGKCLPHLPYSPDLVPFDFKKKVLKS